MDIVVVTSHGRKQLITPHLKTHKHQVSYTPNYFLPENYVPDPKYSHLNVLNHLGAFRCFCGHQDAICKADCGDVLIFEDDAVPNRTDWMDIVNKCLPLLDEFEIVSLHGRETIEKSRFEFNEMNFIVPGPDHDPVKRCLGSLAYLVRRGVGCCMVEMPYRGLPTDLLIATEFKFCVLENSPFDHDRRDGSLVENPAARWPRRRHPTSPNIHDPDRYKNFA
jgi:hypothetical protein